MAAPHDFIPRPDGLFDSWQTNYVAYALENSPALGLSHAEVVALEDAQTTWRKGYQENIEAIAAARSTTAQKRDARAGFESLIRRISTAIRANGAVTSAERAALGLSLEVGPPSPISPPDTVPLLSVAAADRFIHRIRMVDSATPLLRARPHGAIGAELRVALTPPGGAAPAEPSDYEFLQLATRTPALVEHAGTDAGLTAHYVARWVSPRGKPGPWSPTSSATVMG